MIVEADLPTVRLEAETDDEHTLLFAIVMAIRDGGSIKVDGAATFAFALEFDGDPAAEGETK